MSDNTSLPTPNSTPTILLLKSTPQVLQIMEQPSAMIPLRVPRAELPSAIGSALAEIQAVMEEQHIQPSGPFYTHHLRVPDTEFDLQVAIPTTSVIAPSGRVEPGMWPSVVVARVTYQGDYAELPAAWVEFMVWIKDHGHTPAAGQIWESYHITPRDTQDPAEWITELNCGLQTPVA